MYLWENVLSLRFPASLNQDGIWLKREAVSPWWRGKGSPSWVSDPVWLVGLYPGLLSDTCGASPWLVKRVACLLLALIPLHGLVWGTGGIWSLALWGSMFTVLNNQLDRVSHLKSQSKEDLELVLNPKSVFTASLSTFAQQQPMGWLLLSLVSV